jgi:CCR4-NOT transcriptional complex subunit CAF120
VNSLRGLASSIKSKMSTKNRGQFARIPHIEAILTELPPTVLSFMSSFSNRDTTRSPTPNTQVQPRQEPHRDEFPVRQDLARATPTPVGPRHPYDIDGESPQPRAQRERAPSRPLSMVQTYQPPLMDVSQDTLPELQPIFTFLNSHGNKLYQEGYFLKLDDQNTR